MFRLRFDLPYMLLMLLSLLLVTSCKRIEISELREKGTEVYIAIQYLDSMSSMGYCSKSNHQETDKNSSRTKESDNEKDKRAELALDVITLISEKVPRTQGRETFNIDKVEEGELIDIYSGEADKDTLQEIAEDCFSGKHLIKASELESQDNNDATLISAANRLVELAIDRGDTRQSFFGIIITQGSSNDSTITQMKEALKKLEKPETTEISAEGKEDLPEIKISFIGVAPENKQPMSKAFEDVPGLPKFSGSSISEWSQDIDLR